MRMPLFSANRWQRFQAALLTWLHPFGHSQAAQHVAPPGDALPARCHTVMAAGFRRSLPCKSAISQTSQVLRVVRYLEQGEFAGTAGRMRISGRMADVCAELDRLVAREAAT